MASALFPSSPLWSQRAAEQNKCMEVKGLGSKRRKGSSNVSGGYTASHATKTQ